MSKILAVALLSTGVATSAMAENQFGLGASMTGNNSGTIRGIIGLNSDMRLEPYLRLSYLDQDISSNVSTETTSIGLGTAFHMLHPVSANIKMYYGGYLGLSYDKVKTDTNTGTTSNSNTNLNLGPVAGVEYALDPKFTLGAEVSVDLVAGDSVGLSTNSEVLLRYYF